MNQVMIDIETMGLGPGAQILSIAAVEFNGDKGIIYKRDALHVGIAWNRSDCGYFDHSTAMWWLGQSEGARKRIIKMSTEGCNIGHALAILDSHFTWQDIDEVWAKPTTFDIAILEHAYRNVGRAPPWHYRTPRDMRTALSLIEPPGFIATRFDESVEHDALSDCLDQIKYLIEAAGETIREVL